MKLNFNGFAFHGFEKNQFSVVSNRANSFWLITIFGERVWVCSSILLPFARNEKKIAGFLIAEPSGPTASEHSLAKSRNERKIAVHCLLFVRIVESFMNTWVWFSVPHRVVGTVPSPRRWLIINIFHWNLLLSRWCVNVQFNVLAWINCADSREHGH